MSQAMRLYIQTPFCVAKMLVGNTQTRELHPLDAGCAMVSLNKILVGIMYVPVWRKHPWRGVLHL